MKEKKGGKKEKIRVLLKFPKTIIDEPIVSTAILKTKAIFNILRAEVNTEKGELVGEIIGDKKKIENFLKFLKEKNVYIKEIKHVIEIGEGCTDCGLCVSICPTKALELEKDFSIKLNPEKCVLCQACVKICPVKAIKVLV